MPTQRQTEQEKVKAAKTKKQIAAIKIKELEREEESLLAELELYLLAQEYSEAESSFRSYFKSAWSNFESDPYIDNWHIDCICEHAEAAVKRQIRRLLVTVPPRQSKSSILSVALPTWVWGPHKKPQEKFVTASYSAPLFTQFCVQSRRLMNHPWYRSRWMGSGSHQSFDIRSDSNTKTRIDNNQSGYRIGTSPGGAGMGFGYSIYIIDDPLDKKDATSKLAKAEVIDWYKGTVKNRANDPTSDVIILVAQRLAEDDLPGYVLGEEKELWTHVNLPAEYERKYTFLSPINFNDKRIAEGEPLNPLRLTPAFLDDQKRDIYQYATLYQQRPAPPEGGIIKKKWIEYYTPLTGDTYDFMLLSFDLSMVNSESADYTVGTVWGRRGSNLYLVDMVRDKMDIVDQINAVKLFAEKYPMARTKLVEHKANGPALIKMLEKEMTGLLPIEPKEFGGNKEARLAACVPEFNSKCIYFPLPSCAPWVNDVIMELITFPRSKHDDIVDSISQAINWMTLNQRRLTINMPAAESAIESQRSSIHEVFTLKEETYQHVNNRSQTSKSIRGLFL